MSKDASLTNKHNWNFFGICFGEYARQ